MQRQFPRRTFCYDARQIEVRRDTVPEENGPPGQFPHFVIIMRLLFREELLLPTAGFNGYYLVP